MAFKMKTKRFKWLAALLLLVAAMVMPATAWAEITPVKPSTGDGTADSPYQIGTAEELYWFAGLVSGTLSDGTEMNQSACAELTADIIVNYTVLKSNGDLNGTPSNQWPRIREYNGTFDGKGHTISGLYSYTKTANEEYSGLFGTTYSNAEIRNLGIVDSYFYVDRMVGGVCGENRGTIENCYNKSSVSGISQFGGVCGENRGTIENCYNSGKITNGDVIGGVCGINHGTITNCYNTGEVSGDSWVGGVSGDNNGTITNCYYLSGTATGGINCADVEGSAEGKSLTQFASGEVAYLLNEGKAIGTQVWGQQLGTNGYPVLSSDYKVIRAARGDMDANGDYQYWATFSNQSGESDLGDLNVYTAKVSEGVLTITRCSDKIVAKGEGVLVKGSAEYLNAQMLNTTSAIPETNNDLVATPDETEVIYAASNHKLYRLTYNKVLDEEGLGFYLGVVGESADGTQLKATPNKAYLDVTTAAATDPSSQSLVRSFVFPGNDGDTTGIECISVTDDSMHRNGNAEGIFDLQGRKVSKPTKGVYIKNNKKVVINE